MSWQPPNRAARHGFASHPRDEPDPKGGFGPPEFATAAVSGRPVG
jgi:hypothetical protein